MLRQHTADSESIPSNVEAVSLGGIEERLGAALGCVSQFGEWVGRGHSIERKGRLNIRHYRKLI